MRIALADDSSLFREGLSLLLSTAGLDVVVQARDGEQLQERLRGREVDVAILDIRMPPTFTDEGLATAADLHGRHPRMGLLILSTYAETAYAVRVLQISEHSVGYLLKDRVSDVATLRESLERIHRGEAVVDPEIVSRLLHRRRSVSAFDRLSARQREVLQLMAEGRSNLGIARALHLSPKTVEAYVAGIFTLLDLTESTVDNRRVLAVVNWLRNQV